MQLINRIEARSVVSLDAKKAATPMRSSIGPALCLVFAALAAIAWTGVGMAQTQCVGFSSFQNLSANQLQTLQVRVVPVPSLQDESSAAMAFTYFSNTLSTSVFKTCEAKGVNYSSDMVSPLAFLASTAELQAWI